MSLKSMLKNAGLVESDDSQPDKLPVTTTDTERTTVVPPTLVVSKPSPSVATGPDKDIINTLEQAIAGGVKKGYTEFRSVFDAMAGMADSQRYDMALKVLSSTHKISAEEVVESLKERLELLQNEAKNFESAYQQQIKEAVTGTQDEIQKITQTVAAKKSEIQDLESKRIHLAETSGAAQVKLEKDRATFNASLDVVKTFITNELDRISIHAPQPTPSK